MIKKFNKKEKEKLSILIDKVTKIKGVDEEKIIDMGDHILENMSVSQLTVGAKSEKENNPKKNKEKKKTIPETTSKGKERNKSKKEKRSKK